MALDKWAENQGIRLHYLESDVVEASGVPIVFIPGRLGSAEHYLEQMEALAPRRCLAMSLRGRGQSEAPSTGYTFTDHVADVEAVIADSGLEYFCLMAYSIGVPFGIEYAARHPQKAAGLILGNYPAHYRAISPQWMVCLKI
jgi:pimeloyl-ACP methyl ester carboxylesterase